jgi:hypothetical protein
MYLCAQKPDCSGFDECNGDFSPLETIAAATPMELRDT